MSGAENEAHYAHRGLFRIPLRGLGVATVVDGVSTDASAAGPHDGANHGCE
jgi:hypothetical protein